MAKTKKPTKPLTDSMRLMIANKARDNEKRRLREAMFEKKTVPSSMLADWQVAPSTKNKVRTVGYSLNEDQIAWVEATARQYGKNSSSFIRELINQARVALTNAEKKSQA